VFELSGTVDRLFLSDLFEWLHLTRANGRLLLTAGLTTRSFDIVRGRVAFASSSQAAERLASWLLHKELAPRQTLMRALATSLTRGESFTVVVERDAGVGHGTLVEAGRSLASALISRLLREDRVSFRFDSAWPVTENLHVDLELESSKLIMQAAYSFDTDPPIDQYSTVSPGLDSATIEALFWGMAAELEAELVELAALTRAHAAFLAVGEVLNRWVTLGPPLLPLTTDDAVRVRRRLAAGRTVRLEDSPTVAWDVLTLVNGLDAPGLSRAGGAAEAWAMAGEDAPLLVRLVVDSPRWRREKRGENDATLRRVALAREAAGRCLAKAVGLSADVAATAATLPVVVLELVATALASAQLPSAAMQRAALRHLLPVVGRSAATAAGFPEVLVAALTGSPAGDSGARVAALAAAAAGEIEGVFPGQAIFGEGDVRIARAMARAKKAAHAALAVGEQEG